jgi:hypothetical protein
MIMRAPAPASQTRGEAADTNAAKRNARGVERSPLLRPHAVSACRTTSGIADFPNLIVAEKLTYRRTRRAKALADRSDTGFRARKNGARARPRG